MRIAAYARYSSDQQREASLEDQLRNCRNYCERMEWPLPTAFTDAAISGARLDRAGYRQLLDNIHNFDIVLVDDLSRLGRDKDEVGKIVKRLTFHGVRLIGVSDGVDTARKGHKLDVGLRGLMSELYLDDLADKTRRGLEGRALKGASAGGLPYGYRIVGIGERAIDEPQATIVRRIYAEFLAGSSPRKIASDLNQEGIPSPRGGTWALSAIYGDQRRGLGILANPIYYGRQIWKRSTWVKHPDTGRRQPQPLPESEWVITDKPELAIVQQETWDAVQARIRQRKISTQEDGASKGRRPQHLFSGILRCGVCGGPMVVVDRYRYGCATHKDRGEAACKSRLRVARADIEAALLAGIKEELLTDAAFEQFEREARGALKRASPVEPLKLKLDVAMRERDNIMAAIKAGILTPSTKQALEAAEREVASVQAQIGAAKDFSPDQFLLQARETWRRIVATLSEYSRDIPAARAAIMELLGERITLTENGGDLVAEISAVSDNVVAGA